MHWSDLRFYAAITRENQKPDEQQRHRSAKTVFEIDYNEICNESEEWETTVS